MATEIRVPTLGESVTEATIGQWFKKVGDAVKADEPLVELETDKVTVEVPAPASGALGEILVKEGDTVEVAPAWQGRWRRPHPGVQMTAAMPMLVPKAPAPQARGKLVDVITPALASRSPKPKSAKSPSRLAMR
jgi:2-oxoglutarate dehydrogenase E2 component (dihydrolipoamide succinyltransferase)